MADVELYRDGRPVTLGAGGNAAGVPAPVVLENTIRAADIDGGVAAADTLLAMTIPAGMIVSAVAVEVVAGEATVTIDVGDAADPNGWVAAQAIATAGRYIGAGAYAGTPKLYAADTDLIVTPAAATMDAAVLRVVVVGFHMG